MQKRADQLVKHDTFKLQYWKKYVQVVSIQYVFVTNDHNGTAERRLLIRDTRGFYYAISRNTVVACIERLPFIMQTDTGD